MSSLLCLHPEACPEGLFGARCEERCDCGDKVPCHHITGACDCPHGWRGRRCEKGESGIAPRTPSTPSNPSSWHGEELLRPSAHSILTPSFGRKSSRAFLSRPALRHTKPLIKFCTGASELMLPGINSRSGCEPGIPPCPRSLPAWVLREELCRPLRLPPGSALRPRQRPLCLPAGIHGSRMRET